jgi:tRNA A-37 threonylcarbamoyl transferase component Bud32
MTKADSTGSDHELWDADTTPASNPDGSMSSSSDSGAEADEGLDAELGKGSFVGRYQIIQRLGAGGMGVVYRAHDPQLDREVALKLLRAGRMGEQVAVLRMLREAKSAAKIRHPNVVTVYDAGQVDGRVFIAMELMRGTDLSKWFGGRPAWQDVVRVMLQAAQGLRAAHEAGLIHRDFKPDNVVLEHDGNVKVLDFGLARSAYDPDTHSLITRDFAKLVANASTNPHVKLTRTGALMGTLAYMAPEQYAQEPLDARTDQFSFCVTLFMGVYGYRPFAGNTPAALTLNVLNGNIELPEQPNVAPAQLLEVLRKGLATNPNARFSSMEELIHELQRILNRDAGRGLGARMPRWTIAAGLLLLVSATAAGVAATKLWPREGGAASGPSEKPAEDPAKDPAGVDAALSLELATGRGRNKPTNGPQIWMTSDTLRVMAKMDGPHHDIALQAGRIERAAVHEHAIPQLVEALETVRPTNAAAAYDPVTLYVDRHIPFATIVNTIHSAGQAGFLRYDFAVRTDDETRVLEIKPQTDGIGDEQLRRVAVELHIAQDRVRVGARAWTREDPELELDPMRWPLDAGAGSCELPFAGAGLESLGLLSAQLCQLDAVSISVIVGAEDDVTWEQVANVLSAALPSAACSRGIVIEAGIEAMPDCATPIAVAELGAKLEADGAEQEFGKWCFINSRLRGKKECRPTQAACIAEAQHWVANPRRSCRGEP